MRPSRESLAKKRQRSADWDAATVIMRARSNDACESPWHAEGCGGRGQVAHHIVRRGVGPDTPDNGWWLSTACHDWAHAHPRKARELGLIRSAYSVPLTKVVDNEDRAGLSALGLLRKGNSNG